MPRQRREFVGTGINEVGPRLAQRRLAGVEARLQRGDFTVTLTQPVDNLR